MITLVKDNSDLANGHLGMKSLNFVFVFLQVPIAFSVGSVLTCPQGNVMLRLSLRE